MTLVVQDPFQNKVVGPTPKNTQYNILNVQFMLKQQENKLNNELIF